MSASKEVEILPRAHWNQAYQAGSQVETRKEPGDFALSLAELLDDSDMLLELGCGIGIDAAFFADKVKYVVAVDLADVPIKTSRASFKKPNLEFQELDISRDLIQFPDNSFDAVFARRSLHYFDEETTTGVFREIGRLLTPGGRFFFEVKSTNDPNAGNNAEASDVQHFFGADELPGLLPGFEIEFEEHPAEDFFGYESVFLTCRAKKA